MSSIEDELDAALRDIDSETENVTEEKEIDYGQQTADDDWFAQERAQERKIYAQTDVSAHVQESGGLRSSLGDQIISAKYASRGSTGAQLSLPTRLLVVLGAAAVLLALLFLTSSPASKESLRPTNVGILAERDRPGVRETNVEDAASESKEGLPPDNSELQLGCGPLACPSKKNCIPKLDVSTGVMSVTKGQAAKIALLVQMYFPTETSINNLIDLAKQLKGTEPVVDLWVNLDQTAVQNGTHLLISALEQVEKDSRLRLGYHLRVHEYSVHNLLKRYGVLIPMVKKAQKDAKFQKIWNLHSKAKSFAGGFIAPLESLLLWHQNIEVRSRNYQHVWVMDDNTFFNGKISNFIAEYEGKDADLITSGCELVKKDSDFAGKNIFSAPFNTFYEDKVYHGKEYMQRYSRLLLDELDKCSSKYVTALGGQSPCSLANRAGMKVDELRAGHLGDPYEELKIRKSRNGMKDGQIYHPVNLDV
eukprot:m.30581 g.30581  ORF g.30581 m.30581 type:complete len:477 (+) comp8213_c0_seq2:139-1569(+)